jgi:hypothetical protein
VNRIFQSIFLSMLLALSGLAAGEMPSGKHIRVRLGQTISSAKARSGQTWDGTLASDLSVDGRVIARRGAPVEGRVAEADSSGRLSNRAVLRLQVTSVDGTPVNTDTVTKEGKAHTGRNVKAAGGGAALGAIIGAIAGGGKGSAIGAGAGAAAGTVGAAVTGKKDVVFPVESIVTFTIR